MNSHGLSIQPPKNWLPKINILQHPSTHNPDCQIAADNDLAAVKAWLNRYSKTTTFRNYQKEAERFLLWCVFERGLYLHQLKVQDFEAYFQFLKKPPETWVTHKKQLRQGRGDVNWRPFLGPLGKTALTAAMRIINSLMNFLVAADYLKSNPMKLLRKSSYIQDMEERKYQVWARMLEEDEWLAVQQTLKDLPEKTKDDIDYKLKTQFLFSLLYFLGLRIHEVANSTWGTFRELNGGWWFLVMGKGDQLGHIPVNHQLLSMLKIYRVHLNKMPLPATNEIEHLMVSQKTGKPLSTRQLFGMVKAIGKKAALQFKKDPNKAKKLQSLSPHWLRHLCASHQDKAGISGTMIQANLRQRSFATTQIYLHTEDSRRFNEIQKINMSLEPRMIAPQHEIRQKELRIELKGGPLSEEAGLKQFIQAIEGHILKEVAWQRTENVEELMLRYKRLRLLKEPLILAYQIEGTIARDTLDFIMKSINREANMRLFNCSVKMGD